VGGSAGELARERSGERVGERVGELGGGSEPVGRVLGQADREHEIDLVRELRREVAGAARGGVHDTVA